MTDAPHSTCNPTLSNERLTLQAGVRVLESVELDFSRYGDTLFEVLFAGGRLAGGGNVVDDGKKLDINVCCTLEPLKSRDDLCNLCAWFR